MKHRQRLVRPNALLTRFEENERAKAVARPPITDTIGCRVFEDTLSNAECDLATVYKRADDGRLSAALQHTIAYQYLALAFAVLENKDGPRDDVPSASVLFHFAGHAFREIGQLNRAADAYWRAGILSVIDEALSPSYKAGIGTRSLARSKMCYADIGEVTRSDAMHRLEWDARRLLSSDRTPILALWKVTSDYGTSLTRWSCSVAAVLLLFAACYHVAYHHGVLEPTSMNNTSWTALTALYFSCLTSATVSFSDFIPTGWEAQMLVVLNVISMYVLLAVGATILGRKALAR